MYIFEIMYWIVREWSLRKVDLCTEVILILVHMYHEKWLPVQFSAGLKKGS